MSLVKSRWLNVIIVVGLLLRLAAMGGSLWYDEAFSAWLAQLPLSGLIDATLGDVHPPLYYFILFLVNQTLGHSEWALRLPSLLAGTLLIPLVYVLAKKFNLTERAALVAAALTALAPFQIYYSTEARFYALQMLAIGLAALAVGRRPVCFVAACLLALYLHHLSAVFVAVLVAYSFTVWSRRWAVFNALAIGGGYFPGLLIAVAQAQVVGAGYWVLPLDHPGRVLDALDGLLFYTPRNPFLLTGLITSLALVLILADIPQLWSQQRLALLMFAVPLALVVIISLAWRPILLTRIIAPAAPFFYLLIAWSVTQSRRRLWVWGLGAAVFMVAINGAVLTGTAGRTPANEIYRIDGYQPGDAVFHTNLGSLIIWHYYWPQADHYLWPGATRLAMAGLSPDTKRAMGIVEALPDHQRRRWWFVNYDNPTSSPAELLFARKLKDRSRERALFRSDMILDSRLYLLR